MLQNHNAHEAGALGADAVVRMFCAYCRRALDNARTDTFRAQARRSRRERPFSDMRESELCRLSAPFVPLGEEAVFDVCGWGIGVSDPEIADAISQLDAQGQAIILLHYFADWPDGAIGAELGLPRSTVQFRRTSALRLLRALLEEGGWTR